MPTPLTDSINALTRYANETTGASDATLSEAVNTLVEGYGQGGGSSDKWQRPADFPDYSKVDLTNQEVLYYTYKAGTDNSYAIFKCNSTNNAHTFTIDVGTLNNGVYTVLDTDTVTHGAIYFKDLKNYQVPYVVIRITANNGVIKEVNTYNVTAQTVGDRTYTSSPQYLVEAYGRLPNLTTLNLAYRGVRYLKSATLYGLSLLADMTRAFNECRVLENVYIDGTTKTMSTYYAFQASPVLRYLWLNGLTTSNIQSTFDAKSILYTDIFDTLNVSVSGNIQAAFSNFASMESIDLSGWTVNSTGSVNTFQGCSNLKSIDIHTWTLSGNATGMFMGSSIESIPQADYSRVTNVSNMFNGTNLIGSVTMPITSATQFGTAFQYCSAVNSVTIPATYTGQIVAQAFRDTGNLTEIHFLATTPPPLANANAFWYGASNDSRKIYVPYSEDHSVLNAYQTASVWSTIHYPIVEEPQGE